jgi:HSP20 family protein
MNGQKAVAEKRSTYGNTEPMKVDILETESDLILLADLPGVQPENLDVRFEKGELIVHGRKELNRGDRKKLADETFVSHYHRSFRLSEQIAADQISADLKQGVLSIRLPKVESAKPRKIAVRG